MEWHELLDKAARVLELTIESYCEKLNNKETSRYFHANCFDSSRYSWRLKVVNTSHDEVDGIKRCLEHNNSVHPVVVDLPSLISIVRIPRFFQIPKEYRRSWGCSELLEFHKPDVKNIPLLIQKLLDLRGKEVSKEIRSSGIQRYKHNRAQYRCRLTYSCNSLLKKQLLTYNQLVHIKAKFDRWYTSDIPEESLTLVHGDFAFGNLTLADDQELGLIDFEHTHLGSGLTDLAHLYVNLLSDGDDENAKMLIDIYQNESDQRGASFNNSTFNALVLERATGKLNSMKQTTSDKSDRVKRLLLGQKA